MAGFEPTRDGVKVRCLTAWRHPNVDDAKKLQAPPKARLEEKNGVDEGIRTLGLQSHNLAR